MNPTTGRIIAMPGKFTAVIPLVIIMVHGDIGLIMDQPGTYIKDLIQFGID